KSRVNNSRAWRRPTTRARLSTRGWSGVRRTIRPGSPDLSRASFRQAGIGRRRNLFLDGLFFLGDFLGTQPDEDLGGEQYDADEEEEGADRALDEGHEVAAGDQETATEVLLE